jgi:curved DNA-binding protein CbpA
MARAVVTEDYYSLLEVSQFASLATIRESYKKLALKFHPDKNKGETATSDFQRLAIAWETLKDPGKRAEYDRNYVGIAKRKHSEGEDSGGKRRKSEFDDNSRTHHAWEKESDSASSSNQQSQTDPNEAARRQKIPAWKAMAREDYQTRLQAWSKFRKDHVVQAREAQRLISKHQVDLEAQMREDESNVTRKFHEAIEQSRSSGNNVENHASVLSKLLEARRNYINKLIQTIGESQRRLQKLVRELESDRQRYEEEEYTARQKRIGEALEFLGPRDLNPPLFSMIDRRGKAINVWKALARVKVSTRFSSSLEGCSDGPWHEDGEWERQAGEYPCARCNQPAFHIIPECGPAKCPGCSMIACNACYRELKFLREYGAWISSPPADFEESVFSLNLGSEPIPREENHQFLKNAFNAFGISQGQAKRPEGFSWF